MFTDWGHPEKTGVSARINKRKNTPSETYSLLTLWANIRNWVGSSSCDKVCPLSPVLTASNKQQTNKYLIARGSNNSKCIKQQQEHQTTASASNNSSSQQPPQMASTKIFAETTTQSTPYVKSRWNFLLKTNLFPICLPIGEKMFKIFSNPVQKIQ